MGCSFSDQKSSQESLTVVVHGSSHDSRDVLGQQSESTRHLMGTGASLLVLPDGTTWPDGDLRDGMAACVESLTELQAKLVSAGAWTAENREGLSTALDHSRGVYSKLIDEAPAHREEMQTGAGEREIAVRVAALSLTRYSNARVVELPRVCSA